MARTTMLQDNTKQEYAAPEVEIIHFESNQALLQSSGGGGGMPGGIPGENF
jgi:hypothetical protein